MASHIFYFRRTFKSGRLPLLFGPTYDCFCFRRSLYVKKSLKIANGQSEATNRRAENTMDKRKKDKTTNNDLQIIAHEPH